MQMIDLHIHTTYSDGKCDLNEVVKTAENIGLETIAFTDHGFGHRLGFTNESFEEYLKEGKILKESSKINVLLGIEAEAHYLDQVMEYRNDLDFILLSNHLSIQDKKLYEVILEKMKTYDVDAVAHPYFLDKDIEEAVEVAVNRNIAFEINTQRYVPEPKVIEYAGRKGVKFTIGSDAHNNKRIGGVEWGYNMLRKLGIDEDSIIAEF